MLARKVYISSRNRTGNSASSSHFEVEFPQDVAVSEASHVAITDVCIPHSWYNIQQYAHKFWYHEGVEDKVVSLDYGHFTASQIASALAIKLNANAAPNITYTVTAPTSTTNRLTITQAGTGANQFFVYSDYDLMINGLYNGTKVTNPQSLNRYLNVSTNRTMTSAWQSGLVTLIYASELYIRSPSLALDTLCCATGRRDILKKVVVDKEFGGLVTSPSTIEQSDLSKVRGSLRNISLMLTDQDGNVVDLQGSDWSLSLNIVDM